MSPLPELPGKPVPPKSGQEQWLRRTVARLCQLENERFPGSQPISFGTRDLEKLDSKDYWVCEKSDGIRVLLFVQTDHQEQTVYIIDRHNSYRQVIGLYFPHHENPRMPLRNTIVDGELVVDVDPRTRQETLRYLAFDCLVIDDQNVMSRSLDKRYGRLQAWFYAPYAKMMKEFPQMAQEQPFDIKIKDVKLSYHVDDVFNIDLPALQHGTDGLIYTCAETPYIPGTDQNILKWKPPSENSIDFKLVLRFPPKSNKSSEPDLFAKPVFELHVYCGDDRGQQRYEFYDVMHVEDDEWESMKASGEQLDDRIVEVHWDPKHEYWRMMRFRDDKPAGNFKAVVEKITESISDGVEKETLFARSASIRNAWKARHGSAAAPPQQVPRPQPRPPQAQPLPPRLHVIPAKLQAAPPFLQGVPDVAPRYGPLATSRWSKVTGPEMVSGMYR
ncbi:mRNA capping enzyme [Laetiporus sulphureus 93-53]|uniref:mRNA-capping enzyme subunit alpha n=1 Tax=Laetiporus sulphureus 93-53 TaxID=1314785 RepID=A0A165G021_9APHY|nr:mRNA capping enzyme [Laetiporus sulphureus 93-53]KZT09646.1 mRNA capping enzyme [Laetiporus sulphureus 93-53]